MVYVIDFRKVNVPWKSATITLSPLIMNIKLLFNFLFPNNLLGAQVPSNPKSLNVN